MNHSLYPNPYDEFDLPWNAQAYLESLYEARIITVVNRRFVSWGVTVVAINLTRPAESPLAPTLSLMRRRLLCTGLHPDSPLTAVSCSEGQGPRTAKAVTPTPPLDPHGFKGWSWEAPPFSNTGPRAPLCIRTTWRRLQQSVLGPGSDSVDLRGPENVHFERVARWAVMAAATLRAIHAGSGCLTRAPAAAVRGSLHLP